MTTTARMDEYNRGALQYIYCKLNGKSSVGFSNYDLCGGLSLMLNN